MVLAYFGAAIAAGIAAFAVAFGISKIGAAAMESIARQPEASKDIRAGMLLTAVLIEGIGFVALGVSFLIIFLIK